MTFKFYDGKVAEVGEGWNKERTGTDFYVTGDAHGRVVFHGMWTEGKSRKRQVEIRVTAETICAIADAIRCCPNRINEDPATGKCGPQYPPMWIGHAFWHLQNPEAVRPCLDHGTHVIDVERVLDAGSGETDQACTTCGAGPLHASESDDLGRCATCAEKQAT